MSTLLSDLVKRKMQQENLSLRSAGTQAGVAHTTIDRVLKEESVDLNTLEKVCDWVGVPVTSVLDINDDGNKILDQIAAAIALCPELEDVFSEIADHVLGGELDQSILGEVAAFASYRLGQQLRQTNIHEHSDQNVSVKN